MNFRQGRGNFHGQGPQRDRRDEVPSSFRHQGFLNGLQRPISTEQGHFQSPRFRNPVNADQWRHSFWYQGAKNLWYPPQNVETIRRPEPAAPTRWHAPTNLQGFQLFETMLMCGVETGWKKYLAIYWLHFKSDERDVSLRSPLFENDRSLHAERVLSQHLQTQLAVTQRDRLKAITIMQNASPCSRCADGYRDDLLGLVHSGIEISVVFSSFHWVRRLSCREQGHPHRLVSLEYHTNNARALATLRNAGFTVRTTCYQDWERLCSGLRVPFPRYLSSRSEYKTSRRGKEDSNLKRDLEHMFHSQSSFCGFRKSCQLNPKQKPGNYEQETTCPVTKCL